MKVISRPAYGAPAFTAYGHSKSLDFCTIINLMTTNNDSNFIGRIIGSIRDCQTGLE